MKTRYLNVKQAWQPLFLGLAVLLLLSSLPAFAQSTYGTILGTVTDSSGAAVPGVEVVVQDQTTGVQANRHDG